MSFDGNEAGNDDQNQAKARKAERWRGRCRLLASYASN